MFANNLRPRHLIGRSPEKNKRFLTFFTSEQIIAYTFFSSTAGLRALPSRYRQQILQQEPFLDWLIRT